MKKLTLTAASVLLALGTSAFAGPYIGANLGYTSANFKSSTSTTDTHLYDGSYDAGFFGGYEAHFSGKFFLAGEVNVTGYDIKADYTNSTLGSLRYKQTYSYGLDVLPGFYISQDTKLFVIGGLQAGSFKFDNAFSGNDFSKQRTLGAWDLGLGTDLLLNDNFTLRLAYKYTDYNSTTIHSGSWSEKIEPANNQFNLGIIYKFD